MTMHHNYNSALTSRCLIRILFIIHINQHDLKLLATIKPILIMLIYITIVTGYCDPQTLFMLGEDSNTCMGIRARQKGSNRGLLSMLLHGNCRILGAKDSHGRLTARAVSRLLIDDSTSLPALYVETPYGSVDEDSYVAVSALSYM